MKKIISMFLTFVFVFGSVSLVPITSIAETNTDSIENYVQDVVPGKSYNKTVSTSQMYCDKNFNTEEPYWYYKLYFRITVNNSGIISFKSEASENYSYYIYPADEAAQYTSHSNYNGDFERYEASYSESLISGVYYIVFSFSQSNLKSSEINYKFTPQFSSANETYTKSKSSYYNTAVKAKTMKVGTKYKGFLVSTYNSLVSNKNNYTTDFYKITINKSGYHMITFKSNEYLDTTMFLPDGSTYSTYGRTEYIIDSENKANTAQSWEFYLKKGTYYLKLGPSYSNCTYSVLLRKSSDYYKSSAPTIKKVKYRKSDKSIYIKAKKNTKLDVEYQFQIAQNKKFTKKKRSYTSRINANYNYFYVGKKKKTYYLRVRTITYDMFGNKYYSPWSKTKKIKSKG